MAEPVRAGPGEAAGDDVVLPAGPLCYTVSRPPANPGGRGVSAIPRRARRGARAYIGPEEAAARFDRITFEPHIQRGRASIRGMRIPVSVVVGQVAQGATTEEILADYPDLKPQDVRQALEYAAWLAQEEVHIS